MRARLAAAALALLAGCATVHEEDAYLASAPIVRELPREQDAVVPVARFSGMAAGALLSEDWRGWGLRSGRRPTRYRLVDEGGDVALEADADRAGTGLYRRVRVDPRRQPILEWRWRAERLIAGADLAKGSREDAVARLVVSFHGDPARLDFQERSLLRLARVFAGEPLPYAMLIYVWSNSLPAGTMLPSPQLDRIRMVVVESGEEGLGRWRSYRRNVLEDYRRAFGEDPGDIVAVGVLTDTDNTQQHARTLYGDITLRAP